MQILSTGSPKLYEKKKLYNISAELYRDILWTPEAFPGPNLRFIGFRAKGQPSQLEEDEMSSVINI